MKANLLLKYYYLFESIKKLSNELRIKKQGYQSLINMIRQAEEIRNNEEQKLHQLNSHPQIFIK